MKFLSTLLSAIFLASNVLFVHAAEANLWTQRQAAKESSKKEQVQLASLPAQMQAGDLNSPNFLNQFPEIKSNLQTISENKVAKSIPSLPQDYSPYIEGISSQHGRIVQVDIPKKSDRLVVLIQDVHANFEAQSNIVSLINGVYDQATKAGRPLFIGVEGAFESFDFSRFQSFPHRDIVKAVADYFLEKSQISAPSYVGIVSQDKMNMKGIDDLKHYTKNVEAIRSAELLRAPALEKLSLVERELADKKRTALNPALNLVDARWKAFRDGTFEMGSYVGFLQRMQEQHNISVDESSIQLDQFAAAYELEKNLNFDVVNQQRTAVLRRLVSVLKEKDMKKLVAYGLAYKAGKVSYSDYYRFIQDNLKKNKISLKSYPSFEKFIQYVLLTEGIQAEPLMKALYATEKAVLTALTENAEEKALLAKTEQAYLTDRLIQFSLIPEEWERYQDFKNKPIISDLSTFESFYAEADMRSLKIVENVAREKSPVSVLLVGGFHTNEIAHALKEQNMGYVIVQPQISQIADESGVAYLSIFTQEKTPLEQMFKGQTLFVAPNALLAGAPSQESRTSMIATVSVVFMALFRGLRSLSGYAIRVLSPTQVEVDVDGVAYQGQVVDGAVDGAVSIPGVGTVQLGTNNFAATLPKTRIAAAVYYRSMGFGYPDEARVRAFAARTEYRDFYKNPFKFYRDHQKHNGIQKAALIIGMVFFFIGGIAPSFLAFLALNTAGMSWGFAALIGLTLYAVTLYTNLQILMVGHIAAQYLYEVFSLQLEKAIRLRGPPASLNINETTEYVSYKDNVEVIREVLSDLITIVEEGGLVTGLGVSNVGDLNAWITREVQDRGGAIVLDAHREFMPELEKLVELLVEADRNTQGFLMPNYDQGKTYTKIKEGGFDDETERLAERRRSLLTQDLTKGLVFQHLGRFEKEEDPDSNTTHQVANYVIDAIRGINNDLELRLAIERLEAHFSRVTTNKMSDATTALWIIQNLRTLAEAWYWNQNDEEILLNFVARVGRMESYGVFGNNGVVPGSLDEKAKTTAEAIFGAYDDILNKYHIRVNDRIDGNRHYPKMLEEALGQISLIMGNPELAQSRAKIFNQRVEQVIANLQGQNVPVKDFGDDKINNLLSQIVFTNGSGDRFGVLVDWVARSRRHPEAVAHVFVENKGEDEQGNPRFHVIVSQRNKDVPLKFGDRDVPFSEIVRVLEYVQRRKFESRVGPQKLGKIDSRSNLLVSYDFLLTAREIVEALAEHDFSKPFEKQSIAKTPFGVREETLTLNAEADTKYVSFEAGVERLKVSIEALIAQLNRQSDGSVSVEQVNEELVKITESKNGIVLLDTNGMDPNAFLHAEFMQLIDVLAKKLRPADQEKYKTLAALQNPDLDPGARFGMQFSPDLSVLMRAVFQGVIFDHHGKFFDKEMKPNYDLLSFGAVPPAQQELEKGNVNTTMQVLQFIVDTIDANREDPDEAIKKINARLANITTDNFGDASWTLWIAANVERLVTDYLGTEKVADTLIATLYRVAWVEDFGIFGNFLADLTNEDGAYWNPLFKEARDIVFATLLIYDNVLNDLNLFTDRFVRPEKEKEETENMGRIFEAMGEAIDDKGLREQRAEAFAKRAEEDRKKWAAVAMPRTELPLHPLFDEFVVYPGGIQKNGVFSSWHGAASQGRQAYQLALTPMGKTENNPEAGVTHPDYKVGLPFYMLIMSLRNGEVYEILQEKGFTLTPLGVAIKDAQIQKFRQDERTAGVKDGPLSPLLFGRDALQVNFAPNSLYLDPTEIIDALNAFFHENFPVSELAKGAQEAFEADSVLDGGKGKERFIGLAKNVGVDIARKIGERAIEIRKEGTLETESKAEQQGTGLGETPVTRVDKEGNKLAFSLIKSVFPDHKFVGEEGADDEDFESDYVWRLDPVDGTENFAGNGKEWGVLLSLHYRGELVFAINYVPEADGLNDGEEGAGLLIIGQQGKGIEINGVPFTADDREKRVQDRLRIDDDRLSVASHHLNTYHDQLFQEGYNRPEEFKSTAHRLAQLIIGDIDVLPSTILPNYEVGTVDMIHLLGDEFVAASVRRSKPDDLQRIDLENDVEGTAQEGKLPTIAGKKEDVAKVLPIVQDATDIKPQLTKDESIQGAIAAFSFFNLRVSWWNIPILYFLVLLIEAGQFFNPNFVKQHNRTAAENRVLYVGVFMVLFAMLGAGILAFNFTTGTDAFSIALNVFMAILGANLSVHGLWILGSYAWNPTGFHSVRDLQAAQLVYQYETNRISADDLGLGIDELYVPEAAPLGVSNLRNDLISTLSSRLRNQPQESRSIIPVLNLLRTSDESSVTTLREVISSGQATQMQFDLLFLNSTDVSEVSQRVEEMAGQDGRVLFSIVSDDLPEPQLTAMQNKFSNQGVVFMRQSDAELSLSALQAAAGSNVAGVRNINVFVARGSALAPEQILALRSLSNTIRVDYYVLVEGILASTMVVKSSLQAIEQYGQLQRLIEIQA